MMGIEYNIEVIVGNTFTFRAYPVDTQSVEVNAERFRKIIVPMFLAHFSGVGQEPRDVLYTGPFYPLSLEPPPPAKDRMVPAESDELLGKVKKFLVGFGPADPRQL